MTPCVILYFALTGHFNNLGFGYTTRTTRKALKKNKQEVFLNAGDAVRYVMRRAEP